MTLSSPIVEQYQNSNHVIDGDVGGVVQVVGQVCCVTYLHSDSSVALQKIGVKLLKYVLLTSAFELTVTISPVLP